jgi:replicative DNA helicase
MNTQKNKNQGEKIISTGFQSLDKAIGGFRSSCLYTLAGAPSVGKTTLAFSLISELISQKIPLAIFSYELTEKQIIDRLCAIKYKLSFEKISLQNERSEEERIIIENESVKLKNSPIFIEANPMLKMDELVNLAKDLRKNNEIEFLFIDDIQRIPIGSIAREYAANREQEISANVRELKRLAFDLEIPILLISQINRMFMSRSQAINEKPFLSDLRDSGAIENESDLILFLFQEACKDYEFKDEAEIIIAKNRHGKISPNIQIKFDRNIPLFFERKVDDNSLKIYGSTINFSDTDDPSPF